MPEVSSPASSGNLGPGFDVIGLALELRCRVTAEPSDRWTSEHVGPERLEGSAEDIVLTAAQKMSPSQPLRLTVHNDIPLGRGLGSSSAAAAAGAAAAVLANGQELDPGQICDLVTEFEGHADNAASAVFGGLVGVTPDDQWVRLEMAPDWTIVVAIPDDILPTTEARRALRPEIPRPAVVRNLGRLIALIEGLRLGDATLLRKAGGDELHESCRAGLNPRAARLMKAALDGGAAHACWSGAGPSVLAIVHVDAQEDTINALSGVLGNSGRVVSLPVADEGLIVH